VAKPVEVVDDRIKTLVDDMLETMYAADGVGLAATQVDVHERVIVIDTSEGARRSPRAHQPRTHLPERGDELQRRGLPVRSADLRQGPAPRPGSRAGTGPRRRNLRVRRRGLLSVCVQHEMDHLMGKVFVEYLSSLKRDRIKTKMIKKTRDEARS
jgi:peptide deformylase